MANPSASEPFVAEVRAFIAFVDAAATLGLSERLAAGRVRLLALYAAALALPQLRDDSDDVEPTTPKPPNDWPGFGDKDAYFEIFDPYIDDERVGGSLSDDVLDVYADVARGLALWDAGHRAAALWEWRFHFDIHWGDHAIDALRALHRACKEA